MKIAQEQDDKEAFRKINAIIQEEQQQDFWRKLNFVTGKKRTRSATMIQVKGDDGAITERKTQDTVKQLIFSEVQEKRYTLAGEAPICNGALFQAFGYMANTPASKLVLDRNVRSARRFGQRNKRALCRDCCDMELIPGNLVSITITPQQ
jgi:hypothetical protein